MTQHQAEAEPHPIEPELSKQEPSEGHLNPNTTLPMVLRILDNENRLAERADQKAISLLSVLGVFMVFFIVNIRSIPLNLATVVLMTAYVIAAFAAIMHLVLTIKPRIRKGLEAVRDDSSLNTRPEVAFFAGICAFPTLIDLQQRIVRSTQRRKCGQAKLHSANIQRGADQPVEIPVRAACGRYCADGAGH